MDEELAGDMFEVLVSCAGQHALHQYEVANFARHSGSDSFEIPSYACAHNVNYWRGGSFFGLGPSATSYVRGVRTKNWSNTTLYCEQLESGDRAIESNELLLPLGRAGETAAFGLRMNAGWPFELFRATTGFDLRKEWAREIAELIGGRLAEMDHERFKLTPRGLRLADSVAEQFLRPEPEAMRTLVSTH